MQKFHLIFLTLLLCFVELKIRLTRVITMQANKQDENKKILQKRINELTVLDAEMKSLKGNARVYKQQPNSQIYFASDKASVWSAAKQTLDNLLKDYAEIEKQPNSNR